MFAIGEVVVVLGVDGVATDTTRLLAVRFIPTSIAFCVLTYANAVVDSKYSWSRRARTMQSQWPRPA